MYEAAIAVRDIEGAQSSEDGQHVMLTFTSLEGARLNLVVPARKTETMMTRLAQGAGQAARLREQGPKHFGVFSVEWWDVWTTAEAPSVIFSFRLSGGMVMAYSLDQAASLRMAQTVTTIVKTKSECHLAHGSVQ